MNADPLQNILMQTAKNAILRPFPGKWFEPVCVLKYYSDSSFRKPFFGHGQQCVSGLNTQQH